MGKYGAVKNNGQYTPLQESSPNGDYFCPECRDRVSRTKGVAPFFRHGSVENCPLYQQHPRESREHLHAKHLLKWALDNRIVTIDGVTFPPLLYDDARRVVLEQRTNTAKSFIVLDVAIVDADDNVLYGFEVRKTHRTDMASRQMLFRAWEIDYRTIEAIDPTQKEITLTV